MNFIKMKHLHFKRCCTEGRGKGKRTVRRHLQVIYLIRDTYQEYRKNSYNSMMRWQTIQLKMGKRLQEIFNKENTWMVHKHLKRCLTSLLTGKMQSKTMRYHYTPTRMAIMKRTDNTKCCQGYGETGTCEKGTATLGNSLAIP